MVPLSHRGSPYTFNIRLRRKYQTSKVLFCNLNVLFCFNFDTVLHLLASKENLKFFLAMSLQRDILTKQLTFLVAKIPTDSLDKLPRMRQVALSEEVLW